MNILLLFSYDYDFSHLPFYVDGIVGFQLVYFIDFYDKRGHASYICIKRHIVLFTDNFRPIILLYNYKELKIGNEYML